MTARVLTAIGGLLIVMGTMWALQGAGLLMWPAESFMLAEREWAIYGTLTAGLGAVLVWIGVRRNSA
jgi:hypothetical protein